MTMPLRPHSEGRKLDIVLPNGRRLRDMPWGGRQYRAMGIRKWAGGYEAVSLLYTTAVDPAAELLRFTTLDDAIAWVDYVTDTVDYWLLGRGTLPVEPATKPVVYNPRLGRPVG